MEKLLVKWMQEFVEPANPALNGWSPCPYARQARLNNKIVIQKSTASNLVGDTYSVLPLLDSKEVVVLYFDHTEISPELLLEIVIALNKELMPSNIVILEDHPDALEYVNGVNMNFGHAGLFVIQKLDKLNTASKQLLDKGYYDTWDKAALDAVVNWRK